MNQNFLINLLPTNIQELLFSHSEMVELNLSQVICTANKANEYLYFPVDGFISIIQSIDDHMPLEVGMIGREGVLGSELILGINTNLFGAIVQGSGSALKIKVADFINVADISVELKKITYSYISIRIRQLGLSAACEHFHEIGPRLAKWLLMSEDRAKSSTFMMTHEFISFMLGVRRVGITTVAADFRRRGLIQYHRGEMKILNRAGLELEACSCYLKNKDIYLSLIN